MKCLRTLACVMIVASAIIMHTGATRTPEATGSDTPAAAAAAAAAAGDGFWMGSIPRQGRIPFSASSGYAVFRNVRDFGAKGDGSTDDTAAINSAISAGGRCAAHCDSSTTQPAIVYFPQGTYAISSPIIMLYFTQLVGDATALPTIRGLPNFSGIALLDSDPYLPGGASTFTPQNNFYRQVRNFVLDMTSQPAGSATGIHWQVAQATSLQNIVFKMLPASTAGNKQQGIFMENGSGGFMSDLVFQGGALGAFLGNQQFTSRNLSFTGCATAVLVPWNWVWNFAGLHIDSCNIGIDMSAVTNVGSVLLIDSQISNTAVGVLSAYAANSEWSNSTLILDNVQFGPNAPIAVLDQPSKRTLLAGNQHVASWVQGREYTTQTPDGQRVQGAASGAHKPSLLLDGSGRFFSRSKPQYEDVPVSSFLSARSAGCVGDGVTDDTDALQALLDKAPTVPNAVVYLDHGAYLLSRTVRVHPNTRIVGECWAMLMAGGTSGFFSSSDKPQPMLQVGQEGEVGSVEISDIVVQTQGAQPGAILVQWNLQQSEQGNAAAWDIHARVGGSAGTQLQSDRCTAAGPGGSAPVDPSCMGAFLLFHATAGSSLYLENSWLWVADHELDLGDHNQVSVFNGRGLLVEAAPGPTFLWGTAVEHSQLYNYQLANAANVFMGAIQAETPYYQNHPSALLPFKPDQRYSDPDFSSSCGGDDDLCPKAWGLRIVNSTAVYGYGSGMYAFFDSYSQDCLLTESCQQSMVSLDGASSDCHLFALSTKAAQNLITLNGKRIAPQHDNPSTFCQTIALFQNTNAQLHKRAQHHSSSSIALM